MRQLVPPSGASNSAADRIIDHLGPMLVLQLRKRFANVRTVDGTLVPTRDPTMAERSKNYRYSANHQVVMDADTRVVVVVGRLPVNRTHASSKAASKRSYAGFGRRAASHGRESAVRGG